MKQEQCEYCNGRIFKQKTRVNHWRKGKLFVIENVPVGICLKCGERYYQAKVLRKLDQIALGKHGSTKQIRVTVTDYQKARAA